MLSTCALQIRRTGSRNGSWKTLRSYVFVFDALRATRSHILKGQDIQIQIMPSGAEE